MSKNKKTIKSKKIKKLAKKELKKERKKTFRHNRNNRPVIGIDFDDCCGDFMGQLCYKYNEKHPGVNLKPEHFLEWSLKNSKNIPPQELFDIFHSPGFFEDMPEKRRSVSVIKELIESSKYDVYIVTACQSVSELQEKVNWFKKALPSFNMDRIIKCKDKEIIRLDILIDDNVNNLRKCRRYMECVLYDMPHNRFCNEFRRINGLKQLPKILKELYG